jgi:transposase InsO family protein
MPWSESDRVSSRLEFIKAVAADPDTAFVELCRQHGVTAKTGYKWLARYEREGPAGLLDAPPFAKKHPLAIDSATVAAISKLRKEHPRWGPRKLIQRLARLEPERKWPAPSTVGDILKRQGLITPRRRRQLLRAPVPASPTPTEPNDVWAMDFKGHFALRQGGRCHPFTMTDEASRYLLCCHGAATETDEVVRPCLEQCFEAYGLPWFLRSDNGNPFGTRTVGGLSRLVIWLVQLGVTPVRIEPGKPQQNGKHERFHLTLKLETPVLDTFPAQQEAFDGFRFVYNDERPHEALKGASPSQVYRASPRRPGALREPEYDSTFVTRDANTHGVIGWRGVDVHVGKLLAHKSVGITLVEDDIAQLRYGPLVLGYFDGAAPSTRLLPELPTRAVDAWAWTI